MHNIGRREHYNYFNILRFIVTLLLHSPICIIIKACEMFTYNAMRTTHTILIVLLDRSASNCIVDSKKPIFRRKKCNTSRNVLSTMNECYGKNIILYNVIHAVFFVKKCKQIRNANNTIFDMMLWTNDSNTKYLLIFTFFFQEDTWHLLARSRNCNPNIVHNPDH